MTHSLLFDGTLELIDPGGFASEGPFHFETLAGMSWGEPQPIEVAINSLLRDGALTKTESDGNREVTVLVKVKSTDSDGLRQGVAALHRATGKRTTLVWTPPDGYSEPRVFDVETSSLHSPEFDDLAWVRNEQVYRLRLVCLPYWRWQTLVSERAEALPSVGEVIDSCESTTGWASRAADGTYPGPATVAVDSSQHTEGTGSIAVQPYRATIGTTTAGGGTYDSYRYEVTRTGLSEALPDGGYVYFDAKFDSSASYTLAAGVVDSRFTSVTLTTTERGAEALTLDDAIVEAQMGGFFRYTWRIAEESTITGFKWTAEQVALTGAGSFPNLRLDNISVAESAASGKQILKAIAVKGSARTTGSLHVSAPVDSVPLGQVLAFTVAQNAVPLGFRPDLRQWHVSGDTTPDATASKGSAYSSLTTTYGSTGSPVFEAPASLFAGRAHTAVVRARLSAGSVNVFGMQVSMVVDGVDIGGPVALETQLTPAVSGWALLTLGTVYLPPTAIQNASSGALVRFEFKSGDLDLDDAYVFPVDGDLTVVDCGSGTVGPEASPHLWIDSPSTDQPQGGYWRSTSSERADALSAWSVTSTPGTHTFEAGTMLAFVACTNAAGPTVDLEYHPREF